MKIELLLGAAGVGLIFLCTIKSLSSLWSSLLKTRKYVIPQVYADEDGISTEELTAEFSTKPSKIVIAILSCLGLGVATSLAILGTLGRTSDGLFVEDWLNTGSWFLLVIQAVGIGLSRLPTRTFVLGIYGTSSCSLFLTVLFLQDARLSQTRSDIGPVAPFVLRMTQLILTICAGLANASLPRRPHVFIEGKPVDSEKDVSLLSWFSFSWCFPLLTLATKKGSLDQDDLPRPHDATRAKSLVNRWLENWTESGSARKLWVRLAIQHKWGLSLQWFLTLVQSFGNVAPQFVLLNLLKLLEKRHAGSSVSSEAWIWVLALLASTFIPVILENWLFWVSQAEITIPVRAELSSLIFQKALRRKDVKGAAKVGKDTEVKGDTPKANGQPPASQDSGAAGKSKEKQGEDTLTKQSTINLIGVDARRIGDFCSYNNFFPGAIFKLTISFGFLLALIGWQSLLAGILVMAVIVPFNIYTSKRYAEIQRKLMTVRDEKLGVVTEALQGLRQIKFMGIENQWQGKIMEVRARELDELWKSDLADTVLLFCWFASPILFSAASLATYAILYGELTPSVAFTAIGIFKQLELTLSVMPELTTMAIDAFVSSKRIQSYLLAPEISGNTTDSPSISFEDASIAWPSDEEKIDGDERYVLRNINANFPDKELSVITGNTGSGKSLLLASILGESDLLKGRINVPKPPPIFERHDQKATRENWLIPNSIAFVAQIPWIENASIKDNILFGLPFDDYRYNKTLEVCALGKDLEIMPDGDGTEIGAQGINLSGGQRWRVTFARALYSRAGILILDDILSAVDATTGRFIFEQGLTGELGMGRTRILVTHHIALCKSRTKYLVELGDGTVEHSGLLSELEEDGTLTNIISHDENAKKAQEDEDATAVNSEVSSDHGESLKKDNSKTVVKKFVEEERREKGAISKAIYLKYIKSSGGCSFWIVALVFFLLQQAATIGRSWWLKVWTGSYEEAGVYSMLKYAFQNSLEAEALPVLNDALTYYLTVYIGISVVSSILAAIKFLWIFIGSLKASKLLFEGITYTILRTPLRWVDTTPTSRILNRFIADFNVIDSRLAFDLGFAASSALQLVGVIIAGLFVSPYIIVLALALTAVCIYLANFYINGAREVKRLESNAKSPIFELFGSTLSGVATIRAFDKAETYIQNFYDKQDSWTASFFCLWLFNRWVGWRMAMVGTLFTCTVAALVISIRDIDAALAGFALSFSLDFSGAVMWTIRHYTNLELEFNAAERIVEFSELPIEDVNGADPPAAWPTEGRVEVHDLVVGYAPDLPPVLKGVTFSVAPNERIGVVGRTGAGKSSLTLALFRFLEARQGSIHIDGLDVSKMKLNALRSRLAIIPQDPVLFSGTVRSNLDAFDEHTDAELHDALERVHLVSAPTSRDEPATNDDDENNGKNDNTNGTAPSSLPSPSGNQNTNPFKSLLSPITEGGLNLSQGQRQLLCLARAIISRPKVMLLDEATSAVDMSTDALIQRSIRAEFSDATLIVIAHRLSTIADFDKILVMDTGSVSEFDTPRALLARGEGGAFAALVRESGEREVLERMILGGGGGEAAGSDGGGGAEGVEGGAQSSLTAGDGRR